MNILSNYFKQLGEAIGKNWNRFWFEPTDFALLGALRVAIGLAGFFYVLCFTPDLIAWFGADGALPLRTVREISGPANELVARFSLFYLSENPAVLWSIHFGSLAVMLLVAFGWKTRWVLPLSWLVVLTYVHRAPLLSGQAEPVLSVLLIYLTIGYFRSKPFQRTFSLDARFAKTQPKAPVDSSTSGSDELTDEDSHSESTPPVYRDSIATIAVRLAQIHLAGFYLLMALTKLSGEIWWTGEAVWSLIASTESSWLNPEDWGQLSLFINLWTHGIVFIELAFALLIWIPILRPLLIGLSVVHWLCLIPLVGGFEQSVVMIAAGVVFFSPQFLQTQFRRPSAKREKESDSGAHRESELKQRRPKPKTSRTTVTK